MSTGTLTRHEEETATALAESEWIVVAPQPAQDPPESLDRQGRTLDWLREDTVDELLAFLTHEGRLSEVEKIRIALSAPEEQDNQQLVRALISQQWADDWDSQEDSLYDAL